MLSTSRPWAIRFPNGPLHGVLFIHVKFDEIAGNAREVHDIGFGNGAAARSAGGSNLEVFEV